MARTESVKKNKLVVALIILLGVIAIFAYTITYRGGVVVKKIDSTEVVSKLKIIQDKGGDFELTQKNIDELSYLYFSEPKKQGNIVIQGVTIEILNDEIFIQAPVTYKKINLLFSSKGKLSFSQGEISYSPNNFKLGNFPLPKSMVMSQISKLNNKKFYAEDNSIKISPSVFPFNISSLKVVDNKIIGSATKIDIKTLFENVDKTNVQDIDNQLDIVQQQIESATVLMTDKEKQSIGAIQSTIEGVKGKSIEEKKKVISDTINKLNSTIDKTVDAEKKKELEKIKAEVEKVNKDAAQKVLNAEKQTETKRIALTKVKNELNGAYGKVVNSKEQQIISMMISSISKMAANPAYDSSSDQALVKSIYASLDGDSRNRVKAALITSVGGDSIGDLRQAFGF